MERKICFVLCCVLFVSFLICGCGTRNAISNTSSVNYSSEEILAHLINHFSSDNDYYIKSSDFYFQDDINISESSFFAVGFGMDQAAADEYIIIKASDDNEVKLYFDALNSYIVHRIGDFEGYAPFEADKLKRAKIVTEQTYVALFVADNSEEVDDYFIDLIKEGFDLSEDDKALVDVLTNTSIPNYIEKTEVNTNEDTEIVAEEENAFTPRTKTLEDGQVLIEEVKGFMNVYDSSHIVEAYKKDDVSLLTDDNDIAVFNKVKEIIAENIKEGMSAYDKEKAIHDYIVSHCSYDDNALIYSTWYSEYADQPYGCLIDQRAICLGYATTFKMFMDMLDVECLLVEGSAYEEKENHGWNLVKLDDGNWYIVDVTWDDPTYNDVNDVSYIFFNVTEERISATHNWDKEKYPEAVGGEYSDINLQETENN